MPEQSEVPGATICLPLSVVRGIVRDAIETASRSSEGVSRQVAEVDVLVDAIDGRNRSRSTRAGRWGWSEKKVRLFVAELAKGPDKGQTGAGKTANPGELVGIGANEGPDKGQTRAEGRADEDRRAGKVAIIAKIQGNGAGTTTIQKSLSFPPSSPPHTPPLYPPNFSPPRKSPKASAKSVDPVDELVGLIWSAYPRKVGKPEGLKAIRRALASGDMSGEEVLSRVRQFAELRRDEVARGSDETLTPHPSTFFNQKRYADDPDTWRKLPKPGTGTRTGTGNNESRPVFRRTNPLRSTPQG